MDPKIPRKCFPDCRVLRELVDQNVGNRPHRHPNGRGQLLFRQPLPELSMNKTFQIHNGTPSLTVADFWSRAFQPGRNLFVPRTVRGGWMSSWATPNATVWLVERRSLTS